MTRSRTPILAVAVLLVGVVAALDRETVAKNPQDTHNVLELLSMHQASKNYEQGVSMTLNVSDKVLKTSGYVTVSWDNVLEPTKQDWIGAFVAPLDLTKAPSKYRFCSASKTHLTEGKGSLDIFMLNMRHDMVFVYFTNGTDYPIAIAESDSLSFANPNEPMQGHLALGADSTQMRVTWTTRDVGHPIVRYGTSPSAFTTTLQAQTSTYAQNEMCGAPANTTGWMNPGVFHSAVITNLIPRQRYFYQYGDEDFGFASGSFVAPPVVGADSAFSFIAFGDMGQAETDGTEEQSFMTPSVNTTRLMGVDVDKTAGNPELIVHIGDISYGRGYVSQWDNFMAQIAATVATKVPYMTAIGNHERDWPWGGSMWNGTDSGGECGVAYERRMIMPTAAQDEPWYSFEYGSVHFVLISTEHDFRTGSKQHAWVAADLAKVDRTRTPWLIVAGHRPMYIDSLGTELPGGDIPVAKLLRKSFEAMFLKYKVDLFLGAHHHSYQRTCPLDRRVCIGHRRDGSARAPVYMVIGMAGAGACTNVHKHRMWYTEKLDDSHYGYTRSHVNATHLTMEFVSDVDGTVQDSFTLVQPKNRAAIEDEEPGQVFLEEEEDY